MHKLHVTAVAALLAVAVVLGSVAAVRTTGLGAASRHANDAAVAAKKKQLASYERRLRHALAAKTPALPKVPRVPAAPVRPAAAPGPAPSQRVVYHRPPPIVVVKHTHHGDDGGFEAEGGGGDD
jgi:hypothetical protein